MAKGRQAILAGLDIGTSKTAAVIAEAGENGLKFLGAGKCPSLGVQKGILTSVDAVAKCLGQALDKAEKAAGVKAASVYISYNGADIKMRNCLVPLLEKDDRPAEKPGPGRAPASAAPEGVPADERVLYLIPPVLPADKSEGGTVSRVVTAPHTSLEMIMQSARQAGLKVEAVVYGPLAGAEALLSCTEKEFGCLYVDLGAGVTSLSFFNRGALRETAIFPVGGEHLKGDLAIGLRTSLSQAEDIIKNFDWERAGFGDGFPHVTGLEENDLKEAPDSLIKMIIEARVIEILQLLAAAVREFTYAGQVPGGTVLAGGGSRLNGVPGLAESRLALPVRLSSLDTGGVGIDYSCANAAGVIKYAYNSCGRDERGRLSRTQAGGLMDRLLNWVTGNN